MKYLSSIQMSKGKNHCVVQGDSHSQVFYTCKKAFHRVSDWNGILWEGKALPFLLGSSWNIMFSN